jgi:hypothetical protein
MTKDRQLGAMGDPGSLQAASNRELARVIDRGGNLPRFEQSPILCADLAFHAKGALNYNNTQSSSTYYRLRFHRQKGNYVNQQTLESNRLRKVLRGASLTAGLSRAHNRIRPRGRTCHPRRLFAIRSSGLADSFLHVHPQRCHSRRKLRDWHSCRFLSFVFQAQCPLRQQLSSIVQRSFRALRSRLLSQAALRRWPTRSNQSSNHENYGCSRPPVHYRCHPDA